MRKNIDIKYPKVLAEIRNKNGIQISNYVARTKRRIREFLVIIGIEVSSYYGLMAIIHFELFSMCKYDYGTISIYLFVIIIFKILKNKIF